MFDLDTGWFLVLELFVAGMCLPRFKLSYLRVPFYFQIISLDTVLCFLVPLQWMGPSHHCLHYFPNGEGAIPKELGNLAALQRLALSNNTLDGEKPNVNARVFFVQGQGARGFSFRKWCM